MTSVMCGPRLVLYLSGLRSLLHRVSSTRAFTAATITISVSETVKPSSSPSVCVLSRPGDLSLVLPRSPLDCHLDAVAYISSSSPPPPPSAPPTDMFNSQAPQTPHQSCRGEERSAQFFDSAMVECVVQPCPQPLLRDFLLMFPEAPRSSALTVVTVSQKTDHDMSLWSPAVEEEREELLTRFIEGACQICSELHREGHWADFIDPSSGLPYYGPYTNLPLFETDERVSLLGVRVEDLGCCRVLRHSVWGTYVFTGNVFTVAPAHSRVMGALSGGTESA